MRKVLSLLYTVFFIICIYPHPANSVDVTQLIYNCPLCSDSRQSCGLTGTPPSCALAVENGEYESCCTESNGTCTHKCVLKCNQGYYKRLDISCEICPAGSHCQSGATQATPCSAGKYSDAGAIRCTDCPAPYTDGSAGSGATIYKCYASLKAGEYINEANTKAQCPAGNYCSGGITYYNNNGATQCPKNHYCSEGSEKPEPCPDYAPLSLAGSARIVECFQCADGLYYDETTEECTTCPVGYYCTGGEKTACPAGQYNNKTGQISCTLCPGGTFNDKTGQTKCTECPDINTHKATKDKYPAGWYANEGNININSVSNPKWDSLAGKTAETECVGNYNVSGPRGNFTHEAVRYNSDSEQYDNFNANLYYRYPNAGYYLRTKYSDTYCDNPEHQMIYREALPCPAGRFCEGQDKASSCKEGTYGDTLGLSGVISAGYFSLGGAKSATPSHTTPKNGGTGCIQSTDCLNDGCYCGHVAPGHYSTGGGTLYSPSGPGQGCLDDYKCGAIAAGYYSTGGATSEIPTQCVAGGKCGVLAGGYYATCGAKKHNPSIPQGQGNPDCTTGCECGYTDEGYYSSGGGTKYRPNATGDGCLDGYECGPCNRENNQFCPRGSSGITNCDPGKYCSIKDHEVEEKKCPTGTTSLAGSGEITDCFIWGDTQGTQFCILNEDDSCFNLPDGTKIHLRNQ